MLHQNEMQDTSRSQESGRTTMNPGIGNRASDRDRTEETDFYNEWDGGGAGGAYGGLAAEQRNVGAHAGRGPKGYQRSDARITEDVHRALTDDDRLDATDIEVSVEGGVVTLTGTVAKREDRRRAETLLDEISGVSEIMNQIKVAKQGREETIGL